MWSKTALLVPIFWIIAGLPAMGQALHDVHRNAGLACSACHQEAPPALTPPDTACTACHGTMLDSGKGVISADPHRSPHLRTDEVATCSDCHHIHRPSQVTCVICHRGFRFNVK